MASWATTLATWAAGTVTAAMMNAGLRDPITEVRAFVNPSAWQTITPDADFDAGSNGQCRLTGEHVYLRGNMVRDTSTLVNAEIVGTIPSGYRPAQTTTINVVDSATPGYFRIQITTAGVITVTVISGSGTSVGLDGLNFSTT